MVDLWDDRAIGVKKNTGIKVGKITLDIEKGDTLLFGRYKNSPKVVKDIGTDAKGQPTVNGMKLLACRIKKKMPGGTKTAAMVKEVPMEIVRPESQETVARLHAEIADTPSKRAQGLAKRSSVPEGKGMFFDTPGPFWMAGCKVALDLLWLTKSGTVLEYTTMPVAEELPLPMYAAQKRGAAYAIETPAGWCTRHGIQAGDRVIIGD